MKFTNILITLMLFATLNVVTAAEKNSSKTFYYDGQTNEDYSLVSQMFETRYKEKVIDSTCTRQIPYQTEECGYVTKYKTECRTIPGRQDCRQVPRERCSNYTEQECSSYPERVCHTETRQRCETKQKCTRGRDGRRVCRNERVCHPVSERVCRTEYRRRCRPVTRRRCSTYYEQECTWIPSREQCDQVPYQEYVCKTVTKYKTETYACKKTIQVPYKVILGDVEANLVFDFNDDFIGNDNYGKIEFVTTLDQDQLTMTAKNTTSTKSLIFIEEEVRKEPAGSDKMITANYKVKLVPVAPLQEAFDNGIQDFVLDKKQISFTIDKIGVSHNYDYNINFWRKSAFFGKKKKLINRPLRREEYSVIDRGDHFEFHLDFKQFDLDIPSGSRDYSLDINLLINLEGNDHLINKIDLPKNQRMSHSLKIKM